MIKPIAILIAIFSSTFSFCQKTNNKIITEKSLTMGVIEEIQSKELNEKRIINIYLPEGYNKNDTVKYPVVYLLDGSTDEDFIHVVGLYQFYTFPWINRVPKSIVVGIATVDRRRDFTYPTTIETDKKRYPTTGHSEKFINFIQNELQPYIEKKYKTLPSRTIIGQSLGGLLTTEILLKKPELFNQYIIISPSIWWDNGSVLKLSSSILSENFKPKTGIYIGVGKEGLVPGINPRVMEVDANLLAEKIKSTKSKSVIVYFDYLPDENHATISHQAISNALKVLHPIYPNNK